MASTIEMQGRQRQRWAEDDDPSIRSGKPSFESSYKNTFNFRDLFKKKKYIPYWIVLIIILVLVALVSVYHEQIIKWLDPVSRKINSLSWGWIIPILVLVAISFPPLFGHEIVAILCGIVYGLWIGFGIVAAGTFIGEIATYYAFMGVFRKHALKLERTDLNYAALARVTREGGFLIVFLVRLSAIPSHFSTAVFATCGLAFWPFLLATFVTLPKQLITVYLGVIIENPKGSKTISRVVLAISFVITLICAGYVYWQMRKLRPLILTEERQRISAVEATPEYQQYQASHVQNSNNDRRSDEEIATPLMGRVGSFQNDRKDVWENEGQGRVGGPYMAGYHEAPEVVQQGSAGGDGRFEPFRTVIPVGNGHNGQAKVSEDDSMYGGQNMPAELGASPIVARRYGLGREDSSGYSDKPVEPKPLV